MPPTPSSTSLSSTVERRRLQRFLDNPPPCETARSEVQLMMDNNVIPAIRELTTDDQARLLEIVDKAAPVTLVKDTKFVASLGDISSDILMLPNSTGSLQGLEKRGENAVASGGATDVWRGVLNQKPVTFKVFRICPRQDLLQAKKVLWKLVPIWKRLRHENVLPFHGVDTSHFPLALVFEWSKNGNITQYLSSHPQASRLELLLQVARGLRYLHSLDVIHGDLKGANVLISDSGKAQICDYGLSSVVLNPAFAITATLGVVVSSRWLAPEIIDPPEQSNSPPPTSSKPADVFAFAMLTVEVFTGRVPFEHMTNESVVIHIASGKRPARPQAAEQLGLTGEVWEFIQKCWSTNPDDRPTVDEVVSAWERFASREDGHKPASGRPGCPSQFAEPLTIHNEPNSAGGPRKRRRRFCGLF